MVTNAMLPKQFRMKFLSQFRKIVIGTRREIHYIGGSEVLPAPLEMEEESAVIKELATEYNEKARLTGAVKKAQLSETINSID